MASVRSRSSIVGLLPAVPAVFIYVAFFVAPMLLMLSASFRVSADFKITNQWTLANYVESLTNPTYLAIAGRTIVIAGATTLVSLLMAYPLAYYIAKVARSRLLLLLVVVPFWTSFVVRAYAWAVILGPRGLVNQFLIAVGLTDEPIRGLLYSPVSVTIGLLCVYLPFMILSLYVALEQIDDRLIEAGRDLYAKPVQVWRRVILPMTVPGIVTGAIFVFVPVLGEYVVPIVLGGVSSYMSANIVVNLFGQSGQWGLGSAMTFSLVAFVLLFLLALRWVASRVGGTAS